MVPVLGIPFVEFVPCKRVIARQGSGLDQLRPVNGFPKDELRKLNHFLPTSNYPEIKKLPIYQVNYSLRLYAVPPIPTAWFAQERAIERNKLTALHAGQSRPWVWKLSCIHLSSNVW
jgi:hypothetical protein